MCRLARNKSSKVCANCQAMKDAKFVHTIEHGFTQTFCKQMDPARKHRNCTKTPGLCAHNAALKYPNCVHINWQ